MCKLFVFVLHINCGSGHFGASFCIALYNSIRFRNGNASNILLLLLPKHATASIISAQQSLEREKSRRNWKKQQHCIQIRREIDKIVSFWERNWGRLLSLNSFGLWTVHTYTFELTALHYLFLITDNAASATATDAIGGPWSFIASMAMIPLLLTHFQFSNW